MLDIEQRPPSVFFHRTYYFTTNYQHTAYNNIIREIAGLI
jgi:hypothetical protein